MENLTINEQTTILRNEETADAVKYPMYSDLGGYEKHKTEARKISEYYKRFDYFKSKGITLGKGAVLYGPPGTGKTMLAHAIANEANVKLIKFIAKEEDDSDAIVANLAKAFNEAKQNAPCILLVDEIDQIIFHTEFPFASPSDRQRDALRSFLTEIDNMEDNSGVFVIATCNCDVNEFPPSLTRSGRLDKTFELDLPTCADREKILSHIFETKPEFQNISVSDLARYTTGLTCSSLTKLINDVQFESELNNTPISLFSFVEPIQVIRYKTLGRDDETIADATVYHELGHFIADYVLNNSIGILNVTPYGGIGGSYTPLDKFEKNNSLTYKDYFHNCIVGISGKVCADYFTNSETDGAASDLRNIFNIYRHLIASGMVDSHSCSIYFTSDADGHKYKLNDNNDFIVELFADFLDQIKEKSLEIIKEHKQDIEKLFTSLKEKKMLDKYDIESILGK